MHRASRLLCSRRYYTPAGFRGADKPHVCEAPTEMAKKVWLPATGTGSADPVVLPVPSLPSLPSPQHQAAPWLSIAQVDVAPADTVTKEWLPATRWGSVALVFFSPVPSWPKVLSPLRQCPPARQQLLSVPHGSRVLGCPAAVLTSRMLRRYYPVHTCACRQQSVRQTVGHQPLHRVQ